MDAATADPPTPAAPSRGAVEVDRYDVEPLGESYRRMRWIKPLDVEWAEYCDRIMLEHGAIRGQLVYDTRHKARWRARRLMDFWEALGLHPRWEVREHINRAPGGYVWTIEYLGRGGYAG